jgi:hypothetical protein
MLDTGYSMLDMGWKDLFPLRKEPVLSEAEGGLGGCGELDVGLGIGN